jgi:hypothetical protein
MKKIRMVLLVFIFAEAAWGQQAPVRIALVPLRTLVPSVPSADISLNFQKECNSTLLTLDTTKADYLLEAADTRDVQGSRHKFSLTVFSKDGDSLYQTQTQRIGSAVKDVCKYLHVAK